MSRVDPKLDPPWSYPDPAALAADALSSGCILLGGIDGGITGAIAVLVRRDGAVVGGEVWDLPTTPDPTKRGKTQHLDLSGANVHTSLGIQPSHLNTRHFFEHSKPLQELVIPTPYPHLSYVQGFWDSWTPTEYTKEQIESLMLELRKLRADYVVLDMGPGAQEAHLNIFKHAHEKYIVTGPEPTSVEKTYRFIEAFVCYSLRENSTPDAYHSMISTLRDYRQRNLLKPFSFRSYVKETAGLRFDFFESLSSSPLRLIVNSARSKNDENLGCAMKSVCKKYFDLNIDYITAIDYNNAVWQSILNIEHVLVPQPFTPLAGQFLTTCKQIIDPEELRAVV